MGRICVVERSPYLAEYEKMRSEGKTIKEIFEYSKNTRHETMGYWNFQRHFTNHYDSFTEKMTAVDHHRNKIIEETIKKDITLAKRLDSNLQYVTNKIEELVSQENQDGTFDPEKEHILLEYINQSTKILEQFLKWGSKVVPEHPPEDFKKRIMKCMEDFPLEYITKFEQRWEEYGRDS